MNFLLNLDVWCVINKYNEGKDTYRMFIPGVELGLKYGLGIDKSKISNDTTADTVLTSEYYDNIKVIKWLSRNQSFPLFKLKKLKSLEIIEYIYPRIHHDLNSIHNKSSVMADMICRGNMRVVNFLHDKGWTTSSGKLLNFLKNIIMISVHVVSYLFRLRDSCF